MLFFSAGAYPIAVVRLSWRFVFPGLTMCLGTLRLTYLAETARSSRGGLQREAVWCLPQNGTDRPREVDVHFTGSAVGDLCQTRPPIVEILCIFPPSFHPSISGQNLVVIEHDSITLIA